MSKLTPLAKISDIPDELIAELEIWWVKDYKIYQIKAELEKLGYRAVDPSEIPNWCRRLFPDTITERVEDKPDWKNRSDEWKALDLLFAKLLMAVRMLDINSRGALNKIKDHARIVGVLSAARTQLINGDTKRLKDGQDKAAIYYDVKENLLREVRALLPDKPEIVEELSAIHEKAMENAVKDASDGEITFN